MPLYLLKEKRLGPYDSYDSHLIRAKDPKEARRIANIISADEGPIWGNPGLSSCRRIQEEGKSGIIISSFNAG